MKRTALSAILAQPWAIEESALDLIRAIAEREHEYAGRIDALVAKRGEPLDNTRTVEIRNGIAMIPVEGPLMAKANIFAEISGATSYSILANDITAAMESEAVTGVILMFDSPGGSTYGVSELAELIYGFRGRKPIVAHVHGTLASAAYWLASACDSISASETAMIGSIGAVIGLRERAGKPGEKEYEFVSAQSPLKRVGPESEEGKNQFQRLVNDSAQVFIDAVAQNRNTTAENVLQYYGQGAVFLSSDALNRGMIDKVMSFEKLISDLSNEVISMDYNSLNVAALTENRPDLVKAIGDQAVAAMPKPIDVDAARAEGANAERTRIAAIEANTVPGAESIIAACKADPNATGAEAAMKVIAAMRDGSLKVAAAAAAPDANAQALADLAAAEAGMKPPLALEGKDGAGKGDDVDAILNSAKSAGIKV